MNCDLSELKNAESFLESSIANCNETDSFFSTSELLKVYFSQNLNQDQQTQNRIEEEFIGNGPLAKILNDDDITEVLVNSFSEIWCEHKGELLKIEDQFVSEKSYSNFLHRLCELIKTQPSLENPFASGNLGPHRIQIVGGNIASGMAALAIRKHKTQSWTLEELTQKSWCEGHELGTIKKWIDERKNILIIGGTGTGKSSVLSACMNHFPANQRCLILEDSSELKIPNLVSLKLLTRKDSMNILPEVTLSKLLIESLRLRPDRIIVGEVRGSEAKDLLLSLSTGHAGSWSTLHATSPQQALLRLEMLVQLGAPQWSTTSIQKLIRLSIDGFMQLGRSEDGTRKLLGLYHLSGYDEGHFLLDKLN